MVSPRRAGMSKLGCLVTLLLLAAAGYFADKVGQPYLRYLRYKDAMAQEARFAVRTTDEWIRHRLSEHADSLGLPEAAAKVRIRRDENGVSISSEYYETVEFPLFVRALRFAPHVERAF
jgi:hypothetical protein